MAVQNRTNNSNLAFIRKGLPIGIVKEAETIKQDAARQDPMLAGTVMAQLASTRKWIPLASTSENSASQASNAGPFEFSPGDTMVIDVDNIGSATATFDAAAGYVTSSNAWAIADAVGKTILVKVDGGTTQTVTLPTCTTVAQLIVALNTQLVGASCIASATHARIISDKKGTASSIEIVAGGTAADVTFGAATAGTGDVANIKAVMPAEIKTVIEADTSANVALVGTGVVITSPTTGDGSELQFVSGNCLAPMGIAAATVVPSSVDGGSAPAGVLMQDLTAAQLIAGDVPGISILVGGAIINESMVVFEGTVTKNSVVSVSGMNKTVEAILGWNNIYLENVVDVDAYEN